MITEIKSALNVLRPAGYRLLVRLRPEPEQDPVTKLFTPEAVRKAEQIASQVGQVIASGPMAYSDPDKFPDGPWCMPGDWILMRSYAGTRFIVDGEEYRMINDDTVEAVISEPERVKRVG